MNRLCLLFLLVCSAPALDARQPSGGPGDEELSVQAFAQAVEQIVVTNDRVAWAALLSATADPAPAAAFVDAIPEAVTRAVVRVRDRAPLLGALPGEGFALLVDVFTEAGARGRIATWRLDVRRPRETTELQPWRLVGVEQLSAIEGLHRLELSSEKQFAARDLVIASVDLVLRLPAGDVFAAETADGVTALVLIGNGTMSFTPSPLEERGQVRLFAGAETIETAFTAAYIRLNPVAFEQLDRETLVPASHDARAMRRAQSIFADEVGKSFSLDLQDLSRENWSLLPQSGDFLAEVRTRRFDTLTYARSLGEAEDVSLFHRARSRNIAAYASEMKLSARGRFFNEDDLVEYDVLDYTIDATFTPERLWLDGRTRLQVRVKAYALAALTIRLAEELTVHSITSEEFGRLMFLRVKNQNNLVINLPSAVTRDFVLTLHIVYGGPVRSQAIEQESIQNEGRGQRAEDMPYIPPEPNWLFSNRSNWYPQNQVTDYASATIRLTVPDDHAVVATGTLAPGSPTAAPPAAPGQAGRATYTFVATQPVRYLGAVVSKFYRADATTVALEIAPAEDAPAGNGGPPVIGARNTVALAVEANRRQQDRGREVVDTAAEILRLYAALIGDSPYESMTLAMVEHERPGGHAPAYFAVLNNPLPVTPFMFRNDPAMFSNFPEFYLAHEIAHQWWGQAVGWKNYHEQWLSEGFAQYLRRPLCPATARRGHVPRRAPAVPPLGHGSIRPGRGLPRLPPRPHQGRQPRLSRAGLQQGRRGAAHAAAVAGRRGVLSRAAALLRRQSLPEGRHRGSATRDGSGEPAVAGAVLRAMDLSIVAATGALCHQHERPGGRGALRADRRGLRSPGDRDHHDQRFGARGGRADRRGGGGTTVCRQRGRANGRGQRRSRRAGHVRQALVGRGGTWGGAGAAQSGQVDAGHADRALALQALAHDIEPGAVHQVGARVSLAELAAAHMRRPFGHRVRQQRVEPGVQVAGANLAAVEQDHDRHGGRAGGQPGRQAGGDVHRCGVHPGAEDPLDRDREDPDERQHAGGGHQPLEDERSDADATLVHGPSVTVLI